MKAPMLAVPAPIWRVQERCGGNVLNDWTDLYEAEAAQRYASLASEDPYSGPVTLHLISPEGEDRSADALAIMQAARQSCTGE